MIHKEAPSARGARYEIIAAASLRQIDFDANAQPKLTDELEQNIRQTMSRPSYTRDEFAEHCRSFLPKA
jgi:hypothetical protein